MTVKIARKPKAQATSIIIKYETVDIDSIVPFHKNPRIGDIEKVAESLKTNKQFKAICVNYGTKTGRPREILGGNHTWKAAKRLGWKTIEVAWVDLNEVEANKVVLADNGTSDGSTYDDSLLANLLSDIKGAGGSLVGTTYTDDTLTRLIGMEKVKEENPNADVDMIEDAPDSMEGVMSLNNDIFFPSDLPYDIPELRLDMIPDECPEPLDTWAGFELDLERQEADPDIHWLTVWHAGSRGVNWHQAIACFYTEDFHFESVYTDTAKNAKKILNLGMWASIMPNYSVNPDWPIATWVWATYRSYYVGRFFQEAGIKVIPDIQYGTSDAALDLTLLGIPEGAGLVATQVQNSRGDQNKIRTTARLLKEAEDRLAFKNIIVYGFTDADEVMERADLSANIIRVNNRTSRRRDYLNSGSTINTVQTKAVHGSIKKKNIRRKPAE